LTFAGGEEMRGELQKFAQGKKSGERGIKRVRENRSRKLRKCKKSY